MTKLEVFFSKVEKTDAIENVLTLCKCILSVICAWRFLIRIMERFNSVEVMEKIKIEDVFNSIMKNFKSKKLETSCVAINSKGMKDLTYS